MIFFLLVTDCSGLRILADSPRWIVVDKPVGVAMHGDDGILDLVRDSTGLGPELRLVHRLDSGTSGCLMMAKDREMARVLCDRLRKRQVRKVYVALSASVPRKKQGTMRGDMIKARRGAWKLNRSCNRGACACTDLRVFGLGNGDDAPKRLVVAKPFTGKTHQVRCAAKAFGAPIFGDRAYGGASADRLYLHAATLSVELDGFAQDIDVVCKPSEGHSFSTDRFETVWDKIDWSSDEWLKAPPSKACAQHPSLSRKSDRVL